MNIHERKGEGYLWFDSQLLVFTDRLSDTVYSYLQLEKYKKFIFFSSFMFYYFHTMSTDQYKYKLLIV